MEVGTQISPVENSAGQLTSVTGGGDRELPNDLARGPILTQVRADGASEVEASPASQSLRLANLYAGASSVELPENVFPARTFQGSSSRAGASHFAEAASQASSPAPPLPPSDRSVPFPAEDDSVIAQDSRRIAEIPATSSPLGAWSVPFTPAAADAEESEEIAVEPVAPLHAVPEGGGADSSRVSLQEAAGVASGGPLPGLPQGAEAAAPGRASRGGAQPSAVSSAVSSAVEELQRMSLAASLASMPPPPSPAMGSPTRLQSSRVRRWLAALHAMLRRSRMPPRPSLSIPSTSPASPSLLGDGDGAPSTAASTATSTPRRPAPPLSLSLSLSLSSSPARQSPLPAPPSLADSPLTPPPAPATAGLGAGPAGAPSSSPYTASGANDTASHLQSPLLRAHVPPLLDLSLAPHPHQHQHPHPHPSAAAAALASPAADWRPLASPALGFLPPLPDTEEGEDSPLPAALADAPRGAAAADSAAVTPAGSLAPGWLGRRQGPSSLPADATVAEAGAADGAGQAAGLLGSPGLPRAPPLASSRLMASAHSRLRDRERSRERSRGSGAAAGRDAEAERERRHGVPRIPRWPRTRRSRRNAAASAAAEAGDLWWAADGDRDAEAIDVAVQALLADGLAGALQGSARRGQLSMLPINMLLLGDEESWTYEQLLELDRNNVRRGLKQQELWRLDRRKMAAEDDRLDCQVCLSEAVAGDLLTTLPCKHVYHDACITPWFKTHRTCPICRFEIAE